MRRVIDYTNDPIDIFTGFNGSNGKKLSVNHDGTWVMIKFPGIKKEQAGSYSNSPISEDISCRIFNQLGVQAQHTELGVFTKKGKEYLVCGCTDFVKGTGKRLMSFAELKNTVVESSKEGYGTELEDILVTINNQALMDSDVVEEHFWNIFVVDAYLGNFDRHNGNWGFLVDPYKEVASLSPVYDCGSCLYPQASDEFMKYCLGNEDEMLKRIYTFPTSAIKYCGSKISYHDFLKRNDYAACQSAMRRITERIDRERVEGIIQETPLISDVRKEFYCTMLAKRKELILEASLQKQYYSMNDIGSVSELGEQKAESVYEEDDQDEL